MGNDATRSEQLIGELLTLIKDPRDGLPEEVFLFISRITPLVNVDLLIRNDKGQVLLTWRDDGYFGPAWHVPGGIVRFKESMEKRIREVARTELGCDVFFPEAPRAINQVIDPSRDVRGHFISLLYECTTSTEPRPELKFQGGMPMHGQWQWHDKCPHNLVSVHEMYRCHIDRDRNNSGISATQ